MKYYSKSFLTEYLKGLKTAAAQKRALTKEIKGLKEILKDEQEAYSKRGKNKYGFLFGKKIYLDDIATTKSNIELCEKIYKQL